MNLSSTPCTNLESYILCLHCTSRGRDLKEKERNGFRGISQFTVYCYYSHFSFISVLNTVPPPALKHLHNLQPLLRAIYKFYKRVASPSILVMFPWGRAHGGDGQSPTQSPRSSLRRGAALAHPQPPQPPLPCPPVGPVTL